MIHNTHISDDLKTIEVEFRFSDVGVTSLGYSLPCEEFVFFDEFWSIRLYPGGYNDEYDDEVCFQLWHNSERNIVIDFSITIVNTNDSKSFSRRTSGTTGKYDLFMKVGGRDWEPGLPCAQFFDSNSGFITTPEKIATVLMRLTVIKAEN